MAMPAAVRPMGRWGARPRSPPGRLEHPGPVGGSHRARASHDAVIYTGGEPGPTARINPLQAAINQRHRIGNLQRFHRGEKSRGKVLPLLLTRLCQ